MTRNEFILKMIDDNNQYMEFEGNKIKIFFEEDYKERLKKALAYTKLYYVPSGKELIDVLEGLYCEEIFKTGVFMFDHLLITMTKDQNINYVLLEPKFMENEFTNFIIRDYNNHNHIMYGHIYNHLHTNYVHQTEITNKSSKEKSL